MDAKGRHDSQNCFSPEELAAFAGEGIPKGMFGFASCEAAGATARTRMQTDKTRGM
jgi:hypothetical protein